MKKIKFKLNKHGVGTTACPYRFTTFVGNRIKRLGSDCMLCKYRKHIDFDTQTIECLYEGKKKGGRNVGGI